MVISKLTAEVNAGWMLALRSIHIQILEHALGYAWTLIIPMLYAICYIFIKRELTGSAAIQGAEAGWDILRAFAGIMLFQCWMQVVQDMSDMIRRQRGMLRSFNVGPTPFVLAIAFEGVIALVVRAILIVAAIPVLGLEFPYGLSVWLWCAACLIVLLLSAMMVGLLLAPWAVLYGDVRKALSSTSLPLILISPIFYPAVERTGSVLYWLNLVNPVASPLAVLADALRGKEWSLYSIPMLVWGGLAVALLGWSLMQLRRQVPILLERMGS